MRFLFVLIGFPGKYPMAEPKNKINVTQRKLNLLKPLNLVAMVQRL